MPWGSVSSWVSVSRKLHMVAWSGRNWFDGPVTLVYSRQRGVRVAPSHQGERFKYRAGKSATYGKLTNLNLVASLHVLLHRLGNMHKTLDQVFANGEFPFPLYHVTTLDRKALCRALWDFERLCEGCPDERRDGPNKCTIPLCPWGRRFEVLQTFFDFYAAESSRYLPKRFGADYQALRDHRDLADIVELLRKSSATLTREECMKLYFDERENSEGDITQEDQEQAFILAARILTMVDVTPTDERHPIVSMALNRDEFGQRPLPPAVWPHDRSLQVSIRDAFPAREHPSLQGSDLEAAIIKPNLTAINITKMANLKLQGTSNLRDHLKLNQTTGVVEIFHHTSFLKEHLFQTLPRDRPHSTPQKLDNDSEPEKQTLDTDSETSPCTTPCLPRDLALETIYTIHLLFPVLDDKTTALLRTLIANQRFDPDCLNFGTAAFETPDEKERVIRFPVWGSRLMDLYDEIENPKPRNLIDLWVERRSRARHVMKVTIASFLAAVVLGFLSLYVAVFQAVVAWEQLS